MSINLENVRQRVEELGVFTHVGDALSVAEAMANFVGRPPAAYISTSGERAGPNRLSTGHRQRVAQTVSVVWVEGAERRDNNLVDPVEATKRALTEQLVAWRPEGADSPFDFVGYSFLQALDGFVWSELLFVAPYHLQRTP